MENKELKQKVNRELVKYYIARNKETMETLAKALGVTRASLSRKLTAELPLTLHEVQLIADRYHLTHEEIIEAFF